MSLPNSSKAELDKAEQSAELPHRRQLCIPTRVVVAIMVFFGMFMIYALRVNLSVGIVAMVNHTALQSNSNIIPECVPQSNKFLNRSLDDALKDGEFIWDEELQGIILGAFFYGYAVTQVPAGWLADMIGGKWFFGVGILCTAILTLVTPLTAKWKVEAFIALRVVQGLCEGATYPAVLAIIALWFPMNEQSTMIGMVGIGTNMGTVVTLPVATYLIESNFMGGWPSVFYVTGVAGCVWFVLWAVTVTNAPETHRLVGRKELDYIQANRRASAKGKKKNLPWREMLSSGPVWTLAIAKFCGSWGFYMLLTELPSYLDDILNISITSNGIWNGIIYSVMSISLGVGGWSSDLLRARKILKPTNVRKLFTFLGYIGPTIGLALIPAAGCSHTFILLALVSSMVFYGLSAGGDSPGPLDLAPDYSATVMGIVNGFSNLTGFLAPLVVGRFTKHNNTMKQWSKAFYIASGIYVFGIVLFLLFASAEPQPWGISKDEEDSNLLAADNETDSKSQKAR